MMRRLKFWRQARRRRAAIKRALAAVPVNTGRVPCGWCSVRPRQRHTLSCPHTPHDLAMAVVYPEGSDR